MDAHQALLGNVASNIANVNTPGYARRVLELETTPARSVGNFSVGNGVQIGKLRRSTSDYLDRLVRESNGQLKAHEVEDTYRSRAEQFFGLDGRSTSIGSSLNKFFNALNDLSVDPASLDLRANFLSQAQQLTGSIRDTYNGLSQLQADADVQIEQELRTVNQHLSAIAELNGEIKGRESTGEVAVAERDRRDALLDQLSEKMSFNVIEVQDGSINITLSSGFTVVSGTNAKALELNRSPSFVSGAAVPALNESALGFVVFDFSGGSGTGHVNLTDILARGGGTIGGLLRTRGVSTAAATSAFTATGTLPALAERVETLARTLLTEVNRTYLGPDRNTATAAWNPSSGDLDGNTPPPFGLFNFDYAGTLDANSDGLPGTGDLTATGFGNFASRIQVAFSDPRQLAAARDASTGFPAPASFAQSDGRNLEALAALEGTRYTYTMGNTYSFNGTFHENYNETVATIGNMKNSSRVNVAVGQANLQAAQLRRDEISSVSLDEEFTHIIKFQRVFESSAKMLQLANELLENVVKIL